MGNRGLRPRVCDRTHEARAKDEAGKKATALDGVRRACASAR